MTTLAQVTSREGTRLQRKLGHWLTAIALRQIADDTVSLHRWGRLICDAHLYNRKLDSPGLNRLYRAYIPISKQGCWAPVPSCSNYIVIYGRITAPNVSDFMQLPTWPHSITNWYQTDSSIFFPSSKLQLFQRQQVYCTQSQQRFGTATVFRVAAALDTLQTTAKLQNTFYRMLLSSY